jgi:hypothetical protein
VIEIELVTDEPLAGWVRQVTRTRPLRPLTEIRFSGWLGLLEAISMLIGPRSVQAAGGLGGELGAGGHADLSKDAP